MEQRYKEYENISLQELKGCKFSYHAIVLLNTVNIYTLSDLFSKSDEPNFVDLLNSSKNNFTILLRNEILGTTKLLRCKYLNEEPHISFDAPYNIDITSDFGFTQRAINILNRGGYTNMKLCEMIKQKNYYKLLGLNQSGKVAVEEIESKTQIAYQYYQKKSTIDKKADSLEELKELFIELDRLRKIELETLEKRKIVEDKIKEKLNIKK